ncbi:MAG: protein kinase [Gemmatimonadota bacterium]
MSVDDSFLPPHWKSIGPQLDRLLEADACDRAQLLAELTGEDTARRRALEQLLAECERSMPLLDGTASELLADLARDDDADASEPPSRLGGRYLIGEELGRGGMAHVFQAEDVRHGRSVAVKVIRRELSARIGRGRFLREIGMVARLRHPNIMPLFDSGEDDGILYYVMPLETGASLRTRIANGPPIPIAEGLSILRDVARALAYAHEAGIVHRDIKPANVMLSGGAAVVTDFGIGKAMTAVPEVRLDEHVTSDGAIIGTPAYMAPEQATGDPAVDHRADLYSFGCLAYAVLTGAPPFHGTAAEILAGHLSAPPPPLASQRPDLAPAVARIIAQCLQKSPAERPSTARVVLDAFDAPTTTTRTIAPVDHRPGSKAVAGAALIALLATGTVVWRSMPGTTTAPVSKSTALVPVAVLPFRNVAQNAAVDYIATALPSHVAEQLGVAPQVVPFATSHDLGSAPDSVRRLSLAGVGVRSVVEGEVRIVGDSVVNDMRVVDVTSGVTHFQVRTTVGAAQFAELVHRVTDSLRAHLELPTPAAMPLHVPQPEAFRLVSEAEHLWRLDPSDPRILTLFLRASELDPRWYRPFVGLSDFMGIGLVVQAGTRSDPSRASAAVQYGSAALARAGASPTARSAALIRRALPRFLLGDTTGSRADAQLAASLDSTDFQTQSLIGSWFRWTGQLDSAWKYKVRAQRLAPWNAQQLNSLATLQRCAGNFREEVALLTRAVELQPQREHLFWWSHALAASGRFDDAMAAWERATPPGEVRAIRARTGNARGEARWRLTQAEVSRMRLARLRASSAPRRLSMEWIESFEGVGQRDSARAVLADWIKSGAPKLSFQRFCMHPLDAFRRDAQVQAMVRASRWPLAEFDMTRMRALAPTIR